MKSVKSPSEMRKHLVSKPLYHTDSPLFLVMEVLDSKPGSTKGSDGDGCDTQVLHSDTQATRRLKDAQFLVWASFLDSYELGRQCKKLQPETEFVCGMGIVQTAAGEIQPRSATLDLQTKYHSPQTELCDSVALLFHRMCDEKMPGTSWHDLGKTVMALRRTHKGRMELSFVHCTRHPPATLWRGPECLLMCHMHARVHVFTDRVSRARVKGQVSALAVVSTRLFQVIRG
jgi:hypothetical protein